MQTRNARIVQWETATYALLKTLKFACFATKATIFQKAPASLVPTIAPPALRPRFAMSATAVSCSIRGWSHLCMFRLASRLRMNAPWDS